MKIHNKPQTILTGLFLLLLSWPLTSCDDDKDSGIPVIHHVRTTDSERRDSTFVKAQTGQMLLIEGENLGSVRKVYMNNQDVYFNPNYTTSRSIIVTIPTSLELTGTNPELPREIRVETPGGVATYSFHVLSPVPEMLSFIARYPVNPGDGFLILGKNFYEIEKIVLEGTNGTNVEATEYTVSNNYGSVTVVLPEGVEERGELVMYCAAGEARIEYATRVLPPVITSFSTDMPIIGSEFFITGTYFIEVVKVNINGEYDILAEDLKVSETNDTIYLKLPAEPTQWGEITVTAAGGDSESDKLFYPLPHVIVNYDNVGSYSWGEAMLVTGDGENTPFITTGNAIGLRETNVGAWNYWFGNIVSNVKFSDVIAGTTEASKLVFRFECFVGYPMGGITFNLNFGGAWDIVSGYVPKSYLSGKTEFGRWMTCEIPLTDLAPNASVYSDIQAMGAEIGFNSKNASAIVVPKYEIYFDNFRISPKAN